MSPRVSTRPGAQRIVREKAVPSRREAPSRSSYEEFRSRGSATTLRDVELDREGAFWKYISARAMPGLAGSLYEGDTLSAYGLLEESEHRVLSKATGAGGGYLVPSDFGDAIVSARRARNVIAELARNIETDTGRSLPLPTATAHGVGTWTAENAAFPAGSDDTFGQVSVGAFKAATRTIVSEELLMDEGMDGFDGYLADELGQRLALLEEAGFAVGDGTGKPLGIAHASSGITAVVAATGSATGFKLADVRAVWAAVPDAYKPTASWVMSPSAGASLAGLTDTAGGLVLPSLHASEPTLYSRPVYLSPELPAAAANAKSVVVGDFGIGCAVRRVRSIGVQRQDQLYSDNGQVGFRAFERLDGRPVLVDALRVLANSAT